MSRSIRLATAAGSSDFFVVYPWKGRAFLMRADDLIKVTWELAWDGDEVQHYMPALWLKSNTHHIFVETRELQRLFTDTVRAFLDMKPSIG